MFFFNAGDISLASDQCGIFRWTVITEINFTFTIDFTLFLSQSCRFKTLPTLGTPETVFVPGLEETIELSLRVGFLQYRLDAAASGSQRSSRLELLTAVVQLQQKACNWTSPYLHSWSPPKGPSSNFIHRGHGLGAIPRKGCFPKSGLSPCRKHSVLL